ncbi:MAG: hypothetical protein Q7V57_11305 [Actinomycetota bacterium]|nr:hypothetical protein [Actinomycetota bacterium]
MRTIQPKGALVIDWSTHSFDVEWAAARGYVGGVSYLNGSLSRGEPQTGENWKVLTPARLARSVAALGAMMPVFESAKRRPLDGFSAGAQDGRSINADCLVLGYPTTETVLVAYDFDVTPATLATCVAYWDGVRSTCAHPLGAYGDDNIFDAIAGRGCVLFWQAAGWAWSGRAVSDKADVLQLVGYLVDPGGVNADRNKVLRPFPMWAGPDPDPVEDDMTIIYRFTDANAVLVRQHDLRVPGECAGWSGPGTDPKVLPWLAALDRNGARTVTGAVAQVCAGLFFVGDVAELAANDGRHKWTGHEFRGVLPKLDLTGGAAPSGKVSGTFVGTIG